LDILESVPLVCFYTGKDLTLQPNEHFTVSLDRIDSKRGYEANNVVFCGELVNRMKQEMTVEELVLYCELILTYKGNKT
jgi:hypothetical protein